MDFKIDETFSYNKKKKEKELSGVIITYPKEYLDMYSLEDIEKNLQESAINSLREKLHEVPNRVMLFHHFKNNYTANALIHPIND